MIVAVRLLLILATIGCSMSVVLSRGRAAPLKNSIPASALVVPSVVTPAPVTIAEAGSVDTLDPLLAQSQAAADVDAAIFDSLVSIDPSGSVRGDLATRWTHSADGLRWQFHLNPHASWQDGVPLTSADVVFTARLMNSPAFSTTATLGLSHIVAITATTPTRLDLLLDAPYAPFLTDVGTLPILPAHALSTLTPAQISTSALWRLMPIGSGPFQVAANVPGDHITLRAWPSYFGGRSRLNTVVVRFFATRYAAMKALADGRADALGSTLALDSMQYHALLDPHTSGRPLHGYHALGQQWLHLDLVESGFLANTAVRRALTLATPKSRIVQQALGGLAAVADADQSLASSFANPGIQHSLDFNTSAAQQVLLANGFHLSPARIMIKNGHALSINLWADHASPEAQATLRLIAQAWSQVGIGTTIHLVDEATLFGPDGPLYDPRRLTSDIMNAVLFDWTNGPDPDDSYFWSSQQVVTPANPDGGNYVGYRSTQMDALLSAGLSTLDPGARRGIYDRIQRLLVADQPVIFLAWLDDLQVTSARLQGYIVNPYASVATYGLRDWSIVSSSKPTQHSD